MLTCKAVCFSLIVFYLILIFLSWSHFLCGCNVFFSFASSSREHQHFFSSFCLQNTKNWIIQAKNVMQKQTNRHAHVQRVHESDELHSKFHRIYEHHVPKINNCTYFNIINITNHSNTMMMMMWRWSLCRKVHDLHIHREIHRVRMFFIHPLVRSFIHSFCRQLVSIFFFFIFNGMA